MNQIALPFLPTAPSADPQENPSKVRVVVAVVGVPKLLTYGVPEELGPVGPGDEVTVSVRGRQTEGWVVRVMEDEEELEGTGQPQKLLPVKSVQPAFHPSLVELFQWIAAYHSVSIAEVIDMALPRRTGEELPDWLITLTGSDESIAAIKSRNQLLLIHSLRELGNTSLLSELKKVVPVSAQTLQSLEKRGIISRERSGVSWSSPVTSVQADPPCLTADQESAVGHIRESLETREFSTVLLRGVTGSGKTEVYIRAINHVVESGGSALLILPEISLTPQMTHMLRSRLCVPFALMHSDMTDKQRWLSWAALRSGKARVAVGARSAVFAPLPDLRLVIVDEEHESSYKQSDGIRYHARDIAVMRGKLGHCTVVLGSATPSLESLFNVKRTKYRLAELPTRATARPLPDIEIVDLSRIKKKEMISENISPQLHASIARCLEERQQAVILYNRRGFSSFLQCTTCGEAIRCPDCSVTLTFHRRGERLLCHYCGHQIPEPKWCPRCRDPRLTVPSSVAFEDSAEAEETPKVGSLKHRGGGTQRVIDELCSLFPDARLHRLDRDAVTSRDDYEHTFTLMRGGHIDILVGTQMIAKGHDFPNVTLVGVIDADVGLHIPDFRASERAVQLLTQAAGRAGRGLSPGRVVIQTRQPEHPALKAVLSGNFLAFAKEELRSRKALCYPPWGRLLRIVVSSPDAQATVGAAGHLTQELREIVKNDSPAVTGGDTSFEVIGPAPAPIEKLRSRHRWHILVKASSPKTLSRLAWYVHERCPSAWKKQDVRVVTDLDPYDML